SVEAMTQFCLLGSGLATPPLFLIEEALDRGELVEVLPEWRVDPIPVFAVWPANASSNNNVRHLLDHLGSADTI
ncbi:MAG: LysR substrate-binding domain-containing protein, partial [Chromatiales bacterium]|nr:LysR substrate-binding domain-containing protein [Chromatiales bacterium]